MRIYVASKTRHAPMWRELRTRGVNIISTWIDEAGPEESANLADLAERCIWEAVTADRLILYCELGEPLKGALIEIGAALAANVPVYVVGPCAANDSCFGQHPLWHTCASVQEALDA